METQHIYYLADRYYRDELTSIERKEVQLLLEVNNQDSKIFFDYLHETNQLITISKQLNSANKEISKKNHRKLYFWSAIAASIIVAIVSLINYKPLATIETSMRKPLLAKLVQLDEKKVAVSSATRWIHAGHYQLNKGKYQLAFTNGTKVNLNGESDFHLIHESKMKLNKGNIIVKVTKEAKTFSVETPSAEILDLGTVFMVKVNQFDHSNVLVREGSVRVTSKVTQQSKILIKHNSLKIRNSGEFEAIRNLEKVFNLKEPLPGPIPQRENLTWLHWSFEQDLHAINHLNSHNPIAELYPQTLKQDTLPKVCESPFGKGIRFDGINDGLHSKYRGIGGNDARTVSLWARLPNQYSEKRHTCFVFWGNTAENGRKWQLTTNNNSHEGIKGALRLELRQGHLTGKTDLYDGRWHHIAVVFIGGYTSDVATHVMMYIDGVLETITDYRHKVVDTDISSNISQPLSVGLYHGEKNSPHNGDIDELWIFNQALMSEEIVQLRDYNSPYQQPFN